MADRYPEEPGKLAKKTFRFQWADFALYDY